jgi:hypothetical protein
MHADAESILKNPVAGTYHVDQLWAPRLHVRPVTAGAAVSGTMAQPEVPPPSTSTITHCASEGDLQPCGPDHADGGRGTEACDTEASDMCTNKTIARFGKNLGRNFIGRFGNIAHFNDLAASVGGTTKCAIVFSEVPEKSEVSDSFVLGDIGHFISHTSCEGRVNRPRCRRSQCRRPPERPCASTTSTVR